MKPGQTAGTQQRHLPLSPLWDSGRHEQQASHQRTVSCNDACAKLSPCKPGGPGHPCYGAGGPLPRACLHSPHIRGVTGMPGPEAPSLFLLETEAVATHVCVNMGHTQPAGLASCMQSSLADWWLRRARESVSRWRARRGPRARGRLAHLPSPCWRGSLRNSRQRGPLYPTSTSLPLKTPGQC